MSDKILISDVGLSETIKCTICKNPNKTERGCDGSCQYDKELHAKIVEAVTGLAERRPHGEWLWKEYDPDYDCGDIVCSKCSVVIYEGVSPARLKVVKWPFCPNCGADMRGEEE